MYKHFKDVNKVLPSKMLSSNGYKINTYNSPHLMTFQRIGRTTEMRVANFYELL